MTEQYYINKPIDTLFIRTETRSVYEVVRRITQGIFITTPDFQRNLVWNEIEKSKLIESALIRIPLPVIYMAENENGDVVVVDGKQRLSTFDAYLNDRFSLTGLDKNKFLNGKKFSELETALKNRIEDTQLIIYTLDSKINEDVRLDIFERVNSGRPISRQEMRNCLYTGIATKLTESLCDNTYFKKILSDFFEKNRNKDTRQAIEPMLDRLYTNRFIAFSCIDLKIYNSDNMMDVFLSQGLKYVNKNPDEASRLLSDFERSMHNCYIVFKGEAFRKITESRKGPINISIFDVISVVFSEISTKDARLHRKSLYEIFISLLDNKDFSKSISNATNTERAIKSKFRIAREYYENYLL